MEEDRKLEKLRNNSFTHVLSSCFSVKNVYLLFQPFSISFSHKQCRPTNEQS